MIQEPEFKRSWNLFLDDKEESHVTDTNRYYHVCRRTLTAKKLCVMFGPPDFISLDTTLGKNEYREEDDVMELLTYLKDRYKCSPMPFQVHESKAPLAKEQEVNQFMRTWNESVA